MSDIESISLTWEEFSAGVEDGSIARGYIDGQPVYWKGGKTVFVRAREPIWDVAQRISASIPESEWDKIPDDRDSSRIQFELEGPRQRLAALAECAKEEGIAINAESLADLNRVLDRPLIFLLDNGNYRIRWKFQNVEIGIELLGGNRAEVVTLHKDG